MTEVQVPEIDFAADPLPNLHDVLAELREAGPVSRIQFAGKLIWLINDYETVSQVISHDDVLSAPAAYELLMGPSCGRILPTMTGKRHLLNRAVVSKVFFPARMREFGETLFAQEANKLADGLKDVERVDLVSAFDRHYTFNNIARLLGLPETDVAKLRDWADRIMHAFLEPDSALAAGGEMAKYLTPYIDERRVRPEGDLVSLLTQAKIEGEGLGDDDILAFFRNLFPAAIDTSTNSLGTLLYAGLSNRALWRNLPRDAKLREAAIQEVLRWEPPLVMIPRRVVRDVELGGQRLAAGDDVRLCITGANDDPAHFPDPRAFELDRGANSLAFGHGEHFCLGTQMARRVLEKGVEVLAGRFPDMALCPDETVEIVGGVLRGPSALWVSPAGDV